MDSREDEANLAQSVLHAMGIDAQDTTEVKENNDLLNHELDMREKNACTAEDHENR